MIGLAQTGSGKTGAFAIPILQSLLANVQPFFALIIAPARELAIQIAETFDSLGASVGLKTCVLVGGVDMMAQTVKLGKRPHVLIGTPGRIIDHISNTKGFSLKVRCLLSCAVFRILLARQILDNTGSVVLLCPSNHCGVELGCADVSFIQLSGFKRCQGLAACCCPNSQTISQSKEPLIHH